ncbi:hypothetical protein Clacol_004351 [Clathrus columnatus]|uniref:N-acetyltransferase domain-containing protein n=1 Tax=Clathrus columnatus TaxID=1419009 RepID=A0AAV5A768_9AGAM|nr:hypothetical protein Clacol_004351 [Clathrus columnatus]
MQRSSSSVKTITIHPYGINYKLIKGSDITDEQLTECAQLFAQNYGTWSDAAPPPLKPGTRVRMTPKRLREQCVGDPDQSVLALCSVTDDEGKNKVIGQAFATVWNFNVVSSEWRQKGIAAILIRMLPGSDFKCNSMGLASSHPGACLALAKRAHISIRKLNLNYIQTNAQKILNTSIVNYLKDTSVLRGKLFQADLVEGVVSSVFTFFYVDHKEPLAVLRTWEELHDMKWPLGDLLEGHEYFCVVPIND